MKAKYFILFILIWSLTLPFIFPKTSELKAQGWTQQTNLASDLLFISIVKVSIVNSAINIINENPTVPLHTERVILAKKVVLAPDLYAPIFTVGVVADKAIRNNSTDAIIDTRISAIWNSYI